MRASRGLEAAAFFFGRKRVSHLAKRKSKLPGRPIVQGLSPGRRPSCGVRQVRLSAAEDDVIRNLNGYR